MSKKVNMTTRPQQNPRADTWVETRTNLPPPLPKPKRLTIDIDPTLHSRLKLHCVQKDIPIADYMRSLILESLTENTVPPTESSPE